MISKIDKEKRKDKDPFFFPKASYEDVDRNLMAYYKEEIKKLKEKGKC